MNLLNEFIIMFNTYLTSLNINEVLKVLDTIGLLDFFFFPIRVNQVLDAKKKYLNRYDSKTINMSSQFSIVMKNFI